MTIQLSKKQIDDCFEGKTHQSEVMLDIYKLVFPDWDKIAKLEGWPKIGTVGGKYIAQKFMDFDREHHRGVLRGGLWLNNGFSTFENEGLGDFEVSIDKVHIMYGGEINHG